MVGIRGQRSTPPFHFFCVFKCQTKKGCSRPRHWKGRFYWASPSDESGAAFTGNGSAVKGVKLSGVSTAGDGLVINGSQVVRWTDGGIGQRTLLRRASQRRRLV